MRSLFGPGVLVFVFRESRWRLLYRCYHAMYCMLADAVSVYVPLYTGRAREPNGHVYGMGVV
jgi:hypothetical protein